MHRRPSIKLEGAQEVSESAEATKDGRHEIVTLRTVTSTPRARAVSATYKRECTPLGESQPAKRQRQKNEGKARARAVCRPEHKLTSKPYDRMNVKLKGPKREAWGRVETERRESRRGSSASRGAGAVEGYVNEGTRVNALGPRSAHRTRTSPDSALSRVERRTAGLPGSVRPLPQVLSPHSTVGGRVWVDSTDSRRSGADKDGVVVLAQRGKRAGIELQAQTIASVHCHAAHVPATCMCGREQQQY